MQPDRPLHDNKNIQPPEHRKRPFFRSYPATLVTAVAVLVMGVMVAILTLIFSPHVAAPTVRGHSPAPTTRPSSPSTSTQAPSSAYGSHNVWKGTVNPAAIPLGDGKVSTTPRTGYVDSCTTNFKGGGARHSGGWINSANGTWDSETKLSVEGTVSWPNAHYSNTTSQGSRIITTNDLPVGDTTGNFPIAPNDPAYQYDTNPNHIAAQNIRYVLPLNPVAASVPHCLGLGPIGVLNNGVLLYDALDDAGRDAGAHEVQDSCNGHPDGRDRYHYHSVSSCVLKTATGSSTLVGYALDGYGIYVERDSKGNLPTNADLGKCHGRTSTVMWNGKLTDIYHYDATLEYPYTVGCYHGTPITTRP